jgi:hypothetical protein
MNEFAVLTNRKRAIIALVHSVVFLGIALPGFASPKAVTLHGSEAAVGITRIAIYLTSGESAMNLIPLNLGWVNLVQ